MNMKLLKHTPSEVSERSGSLVVNPAKTCQPVGAMYAALGVHGCLPHSHGSQGCCSYHRTVLTRHYKDPIMAATSSFTEGASVFGGQANLLQAIETIFTTYNPDVIAVHTTCLSETIGDDIPQIIGKATAEGKIPPGKYVIHANTPSYVGSHVIGFANMVKGLVHYFSKNTGKANGKVNLIPGWVEPSDMRELKRLAADMRVKTITFPDTSDVVDTPLTGRFEMYPKGGTPVADLIDAGNSLGTLAFGVIASGPAAKLLDTQCKVAPQILTLPIGLRATDRYIDALRKLAGVPVPESVTAERGRVVDMMADMHQYFWKKKVALVGDPDQLVALTEFLVDLDMQPIHIVTGTPGKKFVNRIQEVTATLGRPIHVKEAGDMLTFHQWIKNEPVDLVIGNTYVKYIARDEDIPFLRHGFPILDRVGHGQFPTVGYQGALRLMEQILGLLMDRQDRDAAPEKFELAM
jgi:nitrogenase molybdenum-iron protein beta chain